MASTYELQPGGRVEISNVNGKIDVEPSTGNTVDVTADKKARAGTPEAAKAALEPHRASSRRRAGVDPDRDQGSRSWSGDRHQRRQRAGASITSRCRPAPR